MDKLQKWPFHQGTIPNQGLVKDNDSHEGILFPLVLLPPPSNEGKMSLHCFLHTIRSNREWVDNQLKEVGALLFRGFSLKTASDFNEVVEAFGWEEHTYMGAASRKRVHVRVFTASEAALHQPIHFHHEMSKIAPPEGGQSAIVLSHKITQRMEQEFPELVANLEKGGLLYSSVHPEKEEDDPNILLKSWKTLFQTEDKEEAERAAERASNWKVSWEGSRMILKMGPLTSIRTFDGNQSKKAWFNLLAFGSTASNIVTLGDGSEIPPEAIQLCNQIAEEECVDIDWQVGDVVVLDNRFVQHARRPSKPPRTILAAFSK